MSVRVRFEKDKNEKYKYADLALDLKRDIIPSGDSFLKRASKNADIKTDFDESAIANSLRNLFSTLPRQRILNPEYGLNLKQFLFENANEYTGRLIGRKIDMMIRKYETRVRVDLVEVKVDAENNLYNISIVLKIPSIDKTFAYSAIINENGFTI